MRHEPIVTEAEYDRVQVLLGRSGNPRPKKEIEFAFTGLIRCGECNSRVTAEEKHQLICSQCRLKFAYRNRDICPNCEIPIEKMTGARFLHYTYYHCTKSQNPKCGQKNVTGNDLERQVDNYLDCIQISKRLQKWSIKYLHELNEKERMGRNAIINSQQKAYQLCLGQIDNLVRLKTSPSNVDGSLLSDEEYGRQRLALLKEQAGLEQMLRDKGHHVDQSLNLSEKAFQFACTVRERFRKGDAKIKKEILLTVGSNLTLKDKILIIEAKKPFLLLQKLQPGRESGNDPIEPKNNLVERKGNEANRSHLLRGRAHEESNLGLPFWRGKFYR